MNELFLIWCVCCRDWLGFWSGFVFVGSCCSGFGGSVIFFFYWCWCWWFYWFCWRCRYDWDWMRCCRLCILVLVFLVVGVGFWCNSLLGLCWFFGLACRERFVRCVLGGRFSRCCLRWCIWVWYGWLWWMVVWWLVVIWVVWCVGVVWFGICWWCNWGSVWCYWWENSFLILGVVCCGYRICWYWFVWSVVVGVCVRGCVLWWVCCWCWWGRWSGGCWRRLELLSLLYCWFVVGVDYWFSVLFWWGCCIGFG